jgi:hypothetical protein
LAALVADTRRRYDEVRTEAVRLEAELDKQRRLSDALKEEESHLQQHIAGTRKVLPHSFRTSRIGNSNTKKHWL